MDTVFEQIGLALVRGGWVELHGLGTFSTRGRNTRVACNPCTGQKVVVPSKAVPYFRTGKELLERLNRSDIAAVDPGSELA